MCFKFNPRTEEIQREDIDAADPLIIEDEEEFYDDDEHEENIYFLLDLFDLYLDLDEDDRNEESDENDENDINVSTMVKKGRGLLSLVVTGMLKDQLCLTEPEDISHGHWTDRMLFAVNLALFIMEEDKVLEENWKELEFSQKKEVLEALLKIDYVKVVMEGKKSTAMVKACAEVAAIFETKKHEENIYFLLDLFDEYLEDDGKNEKSDVNGVSVSTMVKNGRGLLSLVVTGMLKDQLCLTEPEDISHGHWTDRMLFAINLALFIMEEDKVLEENWKELEFSQKKEVLEALLRIDYVKEIEEGGKSTEAVKAVAEVAAILQTKKHISGA